MSSLNLQYLFGLLFIGVGFYQFFIKDYLEFSLYAVAGTAFIVNGLSLEPKLASAKKVLGIIAWILIIASAILFLYLLRSKF